MELSQNMSSKKYIFKILPKTYFGRGIVYIC